MGRDLPNPWRAIPCTGDTSPLLAMKIIRGLSLIRSSAPEQKPLLPRLRLVTPSTWPELQRP